VVITVGGTVVTTRRKASEMTSRAAREHDHAVEVLCPSCRNPALVIGYMADGYRCRFCDILCTVIGRWVQLGSQGALPDAWWDPLEADSDVAVAIARLIQMFPEASCLARCQMMYASCIVTTESVPAKQLRARLAEYLDEARSGQTFDITRSGRPAGRLVPPLEENDDDAD
jgi:prevent-host-death family protein